MDRLSPKDLDSFQEAIRKDYGLELDKDELYLAAFSLWKFFDTLINLDKQSKQVAQERFKTHNPEPIEEDIEGVSK